MSLFPAFSKTNSQEDDVTIPSRASTSKSNVESWLNNPSFQESLAVPIITNNTTLYSEEIDLQQNITPTESKSTKRKHKHKKDKKKHKKKDKKSERNKSTSPPPQIFNGDEEYYVDKIPARGYLAIDTLNRPACPKYRIYLRSIGTIRNLNKKTNLIHRYYVKSKKSKIKFDESIEMVEHLSEEEFVIKNRIINKQLKENPGDTDLWKEFIKLQDLSYMKSSKLQVVERKLNILDKALKENANNDELYKMYVEIIDQTYPSDEVSKILDKLLEKDPTNYTLWNAQVLASQGSMARCIVPDVLKLYELCMKSMYRRNRYDEVMLKLFNNCCLFLRQSGLYEQFFALIKLALELNVAETKFANIIPHEEDNNTLVEYEETILQSGLPMNEIWLRIEKLRQSYYFLPCPENRTSNDPQRIVFTEDILHFVYPLVNRELSFNLMVIIMKLLKIPLPAHSLQYAFFTKQENYSEFDAIEDILSIFLQKSFIIDNSIDQILFNFIKDFTIGPSYITSILGHELYLNCVTEFLMLFSECNIVSHTDSTAIPRRNIFIQLWLKFERIIVCVNNFLNKSTEDKLKKLRTKIKNLLKRDECRNVLAFYMEYALIEYEIGNIDKMETIFLTSIEQTKITDTDYTRSEYYAAHIAYVECLIREKRFQRAICVLSSLALNISIRESINSETTTAAGSLSEITKLKTIKFFQEKLSSLVYIERNVEIMELEQCFLPDYLISLIKAKIYYLLLVRSKEEASKELEILLRQFPENNNRHAFVRESIFELYGNILQFRNAGIDVGNGGSHLLTWNIICRGLEQFPNNLSLCRLAIMQEGQAWYKLRTILTKSQTPIPTIFLVAAARHRYHRYQLLLPKTLPIDFNLISSNIDANEITYKIRVCNLLKHCTSKTAPTRKNSLLWRIYLRSLLDLNKNFDESRNILFTALDECPWNKALYLDGTVYVPQELSHLQDLLIEKQLRIYALPEELEILRNDETML